MAKQACPICGSTRSRKGRVSDLTGRVVNSIYCLNGKACWQRSMRRTPTEPRQIPMT